MVRLVSTLLAVPAAVRPSCVDQLAELHLLQEMPASCFKQTAPLQQEIAPQVDLHNCICANKGFIALRPGGLQCVAWVTLEPGNLGLALELGSRHTADHREPEEPLVS